MAATSVADGAGAGEPVWFKPLAGDQQAFNFGPRSNYPDALRFALAIRDPGILVCAASSSKNAGHVLEQIRLDVCAKDEGLHYDLLV